MDSTPNDAPRITWTRTSDDRDPSDDDLDTDDEPDFPLDRDHDLVPTDEDDAMEGAPAEASKKCLELVHAFESADSLVALDGAYARLVTHLTPVRAISERDGRVGGRRGKSKNSAEQTISTTLLQQLFSRDQAKAVELILSGESLTQTHRSVPVSISSILESRCIR